MLKKVEYDKQELKLFAFLCYFIYSDKKYDGFFIDENLDIFWGIH